MKLSRLTVVLLAAAGLTAVAEEYPEFITWMKATGTASDELKKMEQKTGEQAMRRAERIAGAYENMIGFWRQRNTSDAVKWSEEGRAAAMQLATAAYANDSEKANTALKALNGTCRSCHEAHREKIADGKYRIK
jgi:cytochrome c556